MAAENGNGERMDREANIVIGKMAIIGLGSMVLILVVAGCTTKVQVMPNERPSAKADLLVKDDAGNGSGLPLVTLRPTTDGQRKGGDSGLRNKVSTGSHPDKHGNLRDSYGNHAANLKGPRCVRIAESLTACGQPEPDEPDSTLTDRLVTVGFFLLLWLGFVAVVVGWLCLINRSRRGGR